MRNLPEKKKRVERDSMERISFTICSIFPTNTLCAPQKCGDLFRDPESRGHSGQRPGSAEQPGAARSESLYPGRAEEKGAGCAGIRLRRR